MSTIQGDTTEAALAQPGEDPPAVDATDDLVDRFALALKEKLRAAAKKYGYSDDWKDPNWMDECRRKLVEHIAENQLRPPLTHTSKPPASADRASDSKLVETLGCGRLNRGSRR
jgi:hypothetical protein